MYSLIVAIHAAGKLGMCSVGYKIAKQSRASLLADGLNLSIKHINSCTQHVPPV